MPKKTAGSNTDDFEGFEDIAANPDNITDEEIEGDPFDTFSINDPLDLNQLEEELEVPEDSDEISDEDIDDEGIEEKVSDFEEDEETQEDLEAADSSLAQKEDEDPYKDVIATLQNQNELLIKRLEALETGKKTEAKKIQEARIKADLDKAKQDLQKAFDEADSEATVEAQAKIADLVAEKKALEAQPEQDTIGPSADLTPSNPIAAKYVQMNSWINQPGNEAKRDLLISLDRALVSEGLNPREDEYYQKLGARFNALYPDEFKLGTVSMSKKAGSPKQIKSKKNRRRTNASRSALKGGASVMPQKDIPRKGSPLTRQEAINMRRFGLDPTNKEHRDQYILNRDIDNQRRALNRERGL